MAGVALTDGLRSLVAASRGDNWIGPAVDSWLVTSDDGDRIDPGWFHPSSLSHPCDAHLAFHWIGVAHEPRKADPVLMRIFDVGNQRDAAIKGYLKQSGLSIANKGSNCDCVNAKGKRMGEEPRHICIPSITIRGECDDIVENPVTHEPGIAEIKTKRSLLWSKLEVPDVSHAVQVHPYMYAKKMPVTFFIYENKDSQEWKIVRFQFDPALWNSLVARLAAIIERLRQHQVQQKDFQKCTTCPFRKRCLTFQWERWEVERTWPV